MEILANKKGKAFDHFLKNKIEQTTKDIMNEGDAIIRNWHKGYLKAMQECGEFFDREFRLVIVQEEVKDKNE